MDTTGAIQPSPLPIEVGAPVQQDAVAQPAAADLGEGELTRLSGDIDKMHLLFVQVLSEIPKRCSKVFGIRYISTFTMTHYRVVRPY